MNIRTDAHKIIVTDTTYEDRGLYAAIPGARWVKHEIAWYMPRSPVTAMNLYRVAKKNKETEPLFYDLNFGVLLNDMRRIIDEQKYKDDNYNTSAKVIPISTDHWDTDTAPWAHQVILRGEGSIVPSDGDGHR